MAINLTTKALFGKFADIDPDQTDDNAQLDCLIDAVSDRVAKACDRIFELQLYRQWINGYGNPILLLPQWPIVELQRVSVTFLGVGCVKYTGSGLMATVSFEDVGLVLNEEKTDGTSPRVVVAQADNKTLTAMAASVNALDDWEMTVVTGQGAQHTINIRQIQSAWAVDQTIEIDVPCESRAVDIHDELERGIIMRSHSQFPEDRRFHTNFPHGLANIYVQWKAGYVLPTEAGEDNENVPPGLTLAVNQIIKDTMSAVEQDTSLKSERLGDHAITLNSDVIQSAVDNRMKDLTPYMKHQT